MNDNLKLVKDNNLKNKSCLWPSNDLLNDLAKKDQSKKLKLRLRKILALTQYSRFSFAGKPVYWKDRESKTISSKRTWISKMQRTRYIEKYPEDIGNWIFQGTLN